MGKKQKSQDSDGSGISNNGVGVEISTQKAEKKDRKQKVKEKSEANEANGTAAFVSALKVLQKDGLYESKKEKKKKKKRKNSVEEDDNRSQEIEKTKKKAKSENGVEGVSQGLQNGSLVRCTENGFVIGCIGGKKGKEENGIEEKDVTVSGKGVELAKYAALKSFSEAGLPDEVLDCCKTFNKPSPIQSTAWPFLLDGRDFIGIAATGSGKTLAFGVPALMHVRHKMKKGQKRFPRILVLSPTRELAQQIADVLSDAGKPCGVKTVCLYGGTPKGPQISCLKSGVEIVVGTPGRLKDLIEMGFCRLNEVSFVVLDEADRMLDMGFEPEVRSILKHTSSSRQMVMFSATWPLPVHQLAQEFMDPNPVKVVIGSEDLAANHDVMQIVEVLEDQTRDGRLVSLLEKYHHSKTNRVLIFVLYKKEATRVEMFLQRRGWKVVSVHGDRSQESRTKALSLFKSGECPLMIATDVAARGLDIPNVEVVINYSFPLTTEDYVHRIGRTGRAGKKGVAHTFFTKENKALAGELINVLREAGQIIPQELMKFGTHVKKKESKIYGAHFKEITADAPKSKRVTFDDSD